MSAKKNGIGVSVKRREDVRFLTGRGTYTDDINRHGQAYVCFFRSPIANGRIRSVDTAAAAAMPGVLRVFTGADIEAASLGGVPCGWQVIDRNGEPMREPMHPILASGKVRHVGDPVAAVVAETFSAARDAAEKIHLDLEELPAVVNMAAALEGGASVHDDVADNLCFDWVFGEEEATKEAFAKAAHVTRIEFANNRLVPNAIEPRAGIGEYDPASGEYTLYTTSQNPHVIRLLMGAFVLSIPEHKLRVVAPDVGGGFGSKIYHYAEEAFLTWAAKEIGRPLKWTSDRSEAFLSDAHARDHVTTAELAMDAEGKFLGLRADTLANMGAYLSTFAPAIPTYLHATLLAGQYTTPAIFCRVRAVFTNTVAVDAYRGAGRPEATYVVERLVEEAARAAGIDRVEIRRRNFIQPDQFPYQTPVALEYDIGDFEPLLNRALEQADYAGFEARRKEAESRGRCRGIGLSCYIEACGIAPSELAGALGARAGLYEVATVRVNPTGSVSVLTGSHSHGQGHETSFAQVVADRLGIDIDSIDIVHGDTAKIPFGMGTYGSRSIAVGGSALINATDKIVSKARKIAAHLMEASEGDVVFEDGMFKVAGTDKEKAFAEIALAAYVPHNYPHETLEPGLEETSFYDPKNFTFPSGAYICEVEIDPETGSVSVERFTAADDFGNLINPMIVEGQVHGGLTQGIGQALVENCVYDANGQLTSGSFMDYAMPRADDVPSYTVDTFVTPCTHNPLGAKGCGEAGAIGSPAALMNAVHDALASRGVRHVEMPATPLQVWSALQAAA